METFKLARECIRDIAEFDGSDKSQLPEFFKQVEALQPIISSCEEAHKGIIYSYVKNKIIGKARQVIQENDDIDGWIALKEILKKSFGEKRKVTDIVDEIKTLQIQGTIEGYYNKLKKLTHKANNSRLIHDDNIYSAVEVNRIALHTFKAHLPEPTKTLIFARNPIDLDKAYEIVLEAGHQRHTQYGPPINTNTTNNRGRNHNLNYNNNHNNHNHNNNNYNNNRSNTYGSNRQNYQNYNYNNNTNRPHYQTYNNNPNTRQNFNRSHNNESNMSSNTRQTSNTNYNNRNNRNNYNDNNRNQHNYYNNNDNNNSNNNNNSHYNGNRSGNSRHQQNSWNHNQTNTIQSKHLDRMEPMEIGQQMTNFLEQASEDHPI